MNPEGNDRRAGALPVPAASAQKVEAAGTTADRRGSPAVSAPLAVAAIIVVALNLRPPIVSVGPVLPSIIDTFGLDHATASLLTAIPDVFMGLMSLPTPWLARRFGRDPLMILALLLLCLSTGARAFSGDTVSLLVSTAGVGAGIAVAGALIGGFVKARFPARAAVLMGVYATALSAGSAFSAASSGPLASISSGGWRPAVGIWSLLCLFAVLGWLLVMRSEGGRGARVPVFRPPARLPLGNRTAWLISLYFAFLSLVFYGLIAWLSPMYREIGLSTTTAGFLLASFTIAFMCANPVFGWLSRSEDRRSWLALCSALALASLIGIAVEPMFAPFVLVPLCAFGLGGTFTLGMTLPLDNTGSVEECNAWNAFMLTFAYIVAAIGPLLVGYLRDVNGDFRLAMWFLVLTAAAMTLLTPFLRPRRHAGNRGRVA